MSKLTSAEKIERKELFAIFCANDDRIFSFPFAGENGVTVLVHLPIGKERTEFAKVSVAVCSSGEKFKRKRGELIVLRRAYVECQSFPVRLCNWLSLEEQMLTLAEAIG